MGFAAGEGAGAAPAPAGDAGPAPGGGPDLHVDVRRDLGVGVVTANGQLARRGVSADGQGRCTAKGVIVAERCRVGAQGHTHRQDKSQGDNTNFFLHGDQAFSLV